MTPARAGARASLQRRPSGRHADGRCKIPAPDCGRIVIRLRYGIKGRSDRRTTSTGRSAWSTYMRISPGHLRGSSQSDGGGATDDDRRHPFPGGQARASGKTGARLADTGRSGADGIRYAGGNRGGLSQPGVGASVTPGTVKPVCGLRATASVEGAWFMYTRRRMTEPVRPGVWQRSGRGRSGRVILMVPKLGKARRACLGSSVMMAGPGRRGVRHRTVDDTAARAFDTSFAGRGTTIIRNRGIQLTGLS